MSSRAIFQLDAALAAHEWHFPIKDEMTYARGQRERIQIYILMRSVEESVARALHRKWAKEKDPHGRLFPFPEHCYQPALTAARR